MIKEINTIILLTLLLTSPVYSQFTDTIFTHYFSGINASNKVLGLGDQNNDGFDDILIYDAIEQKAKIYFGGNPMDTIPAMEFSIYMATALAVDINHNGYKDIVLIQFIPSLGTKIRIYYGGSLLDTIPDIIFSPPEGSSGYLSSLFPIGDFNGNGYPVLILGDAYLPYSNLQLGALYFYTTYPELDTIPFAIISGDSVSNTKIYPEIKTGDINGDGLTDFTILGYENEPPYYRWWFYLGNPEWNLTPALIYKQEEHVFDIVNMWLIEDINKDGRDDILTRDYNGTYPWWYYFAIWYGSFPVDTIPDHGINAQASDAVRLVCSPGDVNGDGFNDLLLEIGIEQSLRLWLGSRIMHNDPDKSWESNVQFYGKILERVGDVDGDGVNDICIGFGDSWNFRDFITIIRGDTSVKIDTGTVGVFDEPVLAEEYHLFEAYPNPFNPGTVVSWQSPVHSWQTLKVYDLLGREVATLLNEERPAGKYEIEFNAAKYNLSSGVYVITMEANDNNGYVFTASKKLLLLK